MPFNIEAETAALAHAFETLVGTFSETEQRASLTLLERCEIGTSQQPAWNARFKPLTLLYPLLETEGLPGFDPELARRLTLAHECLIIYGFLDDRLRDGQMQFHESEMDFMRRLAQEAVVRLLPEGTGSVPADLDAAVKETMETYRETQAVKYAPIGERFDVNGPRVREILGGRALYGFISTLALARLAGCDEARGQKFREAFDWVATALQWVDDLQDLGEDLALGEENLILRLAIEEGFNAYEEMARGVSPPSLFVRLATSGVITSGVKHARTCFEKAAAIQRELGNAQLHDMLIERTALMDQIAGAADALRRSGEPASRAASEKSIRPTGDAAS